MIHQEPEPFGEHFEEPYTVSVCGVMIVFGAGYRCEEPSQHIHSVASEENHDHSTSSLRLQREAYDDCLMKEVP